MIKQIKKISHTDYKSFLHPAREKLSKILLSKCESSLSKIYLVSSTGGEACEVAMKMSFQHHRLNGCREKNTLFQESNLIMVVRPILYH